MNYAMVTIAGTELKLSQRSIKDIIDASLFDSEKSNIEDKLFLNAFIISSALKINTQQYQNLRFYNIIKKRKLKKLEKLISVENILSTVSFQEMNNLCEKIYELDYGAASLKKKAEALPTSES